MRYILPVLLFFIAVPTNVWAQIAPHHIDYAVSMVKRHAGQDLIDITGTVSFDLVHTCDEWVINHQSDMQYSYGGGRRVQSHSIFNSVEMLNAHSLRFLIEQKSNGRIDDLLRGTAVKTTSDTLDITSNTLQSSGSKTLNGTYVFPIEHTNTLIQLAQAGKKFYRARLFDGGQTHDYHTVNAVIGNAVQTEGVEAKPAWPISLAFYPPDGDNAMLPLYEMHFILGHDGIIRKMDIAYPHFTIRQTMTDIKLLEQPRCD